MSFAHFFLHSKDSHADHSASDRCVTVMAFGLVVPLSFWRFQDFALLVEFFSSLHPVSGFWFIFFCGCLSQRTRRQEKPLHSSAGVDAADVQCQRGKPLPVAENKQEAVIGSPTEHQLANLHKWKFQRNAKRSAGQSGAWFE